MYRKQANRDSFLQVKSKHRKSLKDCIPYSQVIRIKRICTTSKNFEHYCGQLKQRFLEQGYNSGLLDKHIKTVEKLNMDELIKGDKKDTPINTRTGTGTNCGLEILH